MFKNLFKKKEKSEINGKVELDFYQLLEDDYYDAYPEQWEKEDRHAVGLRFVAILEGRTDRVNVPNYKGGIVTRNYIKRGKRKLWGIGDTYKVSPERIISSEDKLLGKTSSGMEKRQLVQVLSLKESVGSIMLTEIIPGDPETTLVFRIA